MAGGVVNHREPPRTTMTAIVKVKSVGAKKNKKGKKNKKREMLCLANSRKPGGRCVAGLLPDGSWIRPVTATEGGSLTSAMCTLDKGRPVRALDVVRVGVTQPEPRLHQPENWVITGKRWKLVETRNLDDIQDFLDEALTDEPELLGTKTNRVTRAQIQEHPPSASLALIKVNHPVFGWSPNKSSQRRARFEYHGVGYDLPITFEFDLPQQGEQRHRSNSAWYFTISLGEPWEEQGGACYKLVACALEAPA